MPRKRSKPSAADVRRMGGLPLDLVVPRWCLSYAIWRTRSEDTLYALDMARKQDGNAVTVSLSERDTKALVAACEAGGRTRTAAVFTAALKRALRPADQMDPIDHLQLLADLGELEPGDHELLRGAMAKRGQAETPGGLF